VQKKSLLFGDASYELERSGFKACVLKGGQTDGVGRSFKLGRSVLMNANAGLIGQDGAEKNMGAWLQCGGSGYIGGKDLLP
jgi:hypothetical protein